MCHQHDFVSFEIQYTANLHGAAAEKLRVNIMTGHYTYNPRNRKNTILRKHSLHDVPPDNLNSCTVIFLRTTIKILKVLPSLAHDKCVGLLQCENPHHPLQQQLRLERTSPIQVYRVIFSIQY